MLLTERWQQLPTASVSLKQIIINSAETIVFNKTSRPTDLTRVVCADRNGILHLCIIASTATDLVLTSTRVVTDHRTLCVLRGTAKIFWDMVIITTFHFADLRLAATNSSVKFIKEQCDTLVKSADLMKSVTVTPSLLTLDLSESQFMKLMTTIANNFSDGSIPEETEETIEYP
jgi:hypothetical protein